MMMLKKYRHCMNPTACVVEFMRMVGADHSPPLEGWQAQPDGVVVACLHKPNRPRHQIMVTVNEMDRMDCLYRRNALGRIYKSAPTVHEIFF